MDLTCSVVNVQGLIPESPYKALQIWGMDRQTIQERAINSYIVPHCEVCAGTLASLLVRLGTSFVVCALANPKSGSIQETGIYYIAAYSAINFPGGAPIHTIERDCLFHFSESFPALAREWAMDAILSSADDFEAAVAAYVNS